MAALDVASSNWWAAQERLWGLYPQMWLFVREAFFAQQPWVVMQPTPWRRWGDPASTWIDR